MNIQIVHTLPEDVWRDFVYRNPTGNIFHTPEMFRVFEDANKHQPTLWAAVNINQEVLALLLPVHVSLNDGLFRMLTTRAVVYGSVLWDSSDEGRNALSLLLREYSEETDDHAALFTELRNITSVEDVKPILQENGFVYESYLNYLIDLDCTPEIVFQNIGRRTRKNIRHGLNRGAVVIEEIKNLEQVEVCYNLLCKTYHEAQVPLADRSLFEGAFKRLYSQGMIKFTLAYVNEVPVATSVDLLYKDVIFGWYGGMDRSYSSYVPNELLMWHILEWGAKNGYCLYDFGGAGKPDEEYGVREFKAKFGGALVSYGRHSRISNPLVFKVSKLGYNLYRRIL